MEVNLGNIAVGSLGQSITLGGAIVGLVAGVKKQYPQVTGVYAWVLAVALGAVAGLFNIGVQGVIPGALVGLFSSGLFETFRSR